MNKTTYEKMKQSYSTHNTNRINDNNEESSGCAQWICMNSEVFDGLCVDGGCYGLKVCFPPNVYVEILIPSLVALGGGTFD